MSVLDREIILSNSITMELIRTDCAIFIFAKQIKYHGMCSNIAEETLCL